MPHFTNQGAPAGNRLGGLLRWVATRRRTPWPKHVENPPAPKPLARVERGIRVTLIGHATVLLQVAGLNIITDPAWSHRVGPASWLGVARVRDPAIAFADLPRIDLILLSHNHYDHCDLPTLAALVARDDPRLLTGLGVGGILPTLRVEELDWWQQREVAPGVRIVYVPARHFSGRGLLDRNRSLWGGFVIAAPDGTIYFAADTGDGPHFAEIAARFSPIALALLPIGAFAPRWFMQAVHMDPAQAVAAAATLGAAAAMPIHFGTFPLADDGIDEAHDQWQRAIAARAHENAVLIAPRFGEAVMVTGKT